MDKNSKIFVAGGTGLVGSAIVKKLVEHGYKNIIASYLTKEPPSMKDVQFFKVDLMNQVEVSHFFSNEKPEYVFLAAAIVGGIHANNTYRADFIYNNLNIQNNTVHFSYKNNVKKLMFLGSSCIYPRDCPQPMKEDSLLTSTLEYTNEPYAVAKIAGIKLCESYNIQYGTNFISVMPTNLYGPNDNFDLDKSHVLPAILRKMHLAKLYKNQKKEEICKDLKVKEWSEALKILDKHLITEKSVTLWGTGEPRREFMYSEDMGEACIYLMEKVDFKDLITNAKDIKNTHINIGTGIDISLKDLASLIKDIVGYDGEIFWDSTKPNGTMLKLLSVEKLHSLGYKESIQLKEGIEKVYRNYLG